VGGGFVFRRPEAREIPVLDDPAAEARIQALRRRVERDTTSRLFVGLAEEYRAAGHLPEAIGTLEKGLATHPDYVSARVALARAYLEAGRTDDAAAMFVKALERDPGNLVAARCLADIHLSRGDRLEAIKRYRLYRDLSGDRAVDEIIEKAEAEIGPNPQPASDARGRVLADLYFKQGHYAEALAAYEGLWRADPSDPELARQKSETAARLEAAGPGSPAASRPDPDATRRAARIEALKRWLAVIKTR
jgi:tetratricopeptide (TPR) repeat protein